MKPVICYDIVADKWGVRVGGKSEMLTEAELREKHGISNHIIYCQVQYKELKKGHAKSARDVNHTHC